MRCLLSSVSNTSFTHIPLGTLVYRIHYRLEGYVIKMIADGAAYNFTASWNKYPAYFYFRVIVFIYHYWSLSLQEFILKSVSIIIPLCKNPFLSFRCFPFLSYLSSFYMCTASFVKEHFSHIIFLYASIFYSKKWRRIQFWGRSRTTASYLCSRNYVWYLGR